jgi:acid phosphatase
LQSACVNESEQHVFTSQPAPGNSTPISINIVGDLGFDNFFNDYLAHFTFEALINAADNTNLFFHVGDISYADDFPLAPKDQRNYELLWNSFQKKLEPLTSERFYMTAPGNHEVTCIQASYAACNDDISQQYRNFSAYLHRFSMPGNVSDGSYRNLWYSFDYGLAHFVIINTETDFRDAPSGPDKPLHGGNFSEPGAQRKWLEKDLVRANQHRDVVPWIIVFGHRPFFGSISVYSSSTNDSNCDACRLAFADIIFDQKVDFYFNGHVHYYERLYPVNRNGTILTKNYTEPAGPIYITTGGGGAPEPLDSVFLNASATANYIYDFGYTRLEIKNSSYCELSFSKAQAKEKVDLVQINRTHHKVPSCSS